jgi:hypothetical protein
MELSSVTGLNIDTLKFVLAEAVLPAMAS